MEDAKLIPISTRITWKSYMEEQVRNSKALPLTLSILALEIPYRTLGYLNFKEFLEAFNINVKKDILNRTNPTQIYPPKTSPLKVGDNVQYRYKGKEVQGTVKWLGVIRRISCAGIEFTKQIGFPSKSSGLPFPNTPGYARILPIRNVNKIHGFSNVNLKTPKVKVAKTSKTTKSPKKDLPVSLVNNEEKNVPKNDPAKNVPKPDESPEPIDLKTTFPTLYRHLTCCNPNDNANEDNNKTYYNLVPKKRFKGDSYTGLTPPVSPLDVEVPSSTKTFPSEEILNGNGDNAAVNVPDTSGDDLRKDFLGAAATDELEVGKYPRFSQMYLGMN